MTTIDDVVYTQNQNLLTLKGTIIIHFLDGTFLEGEYAAQDAFNIFLIVDSGPVMVPRAQIKFIRGASGQPIEKDTASATFFQPSPAPPEPEPYQEAAPVSYEDDLDEEEDTLVLVTEEPEEEEFTVEEEEGTIILPAPGQEAGLEMPASESGADEGTLLVAPAEGEEPALEVDLPPSDAAEATAEDETIVLDESFDWGDTFDEEDTTLVLEQEPESEPEPDQPSTLLTCTGGPHAGEELILKSGLTTLGRASDNHFVLNKDKEVSRHHAIILEEAGRFVIQDQNSLNGTFVNDQQITGPEYLDDGDTVLIGVSTFSFEQK